MDKRKTSVESVSGQGLELKCTCKDPGGSYTQAEYYGVTILLCRKCMDKMTVALIGGK